MSLLNRQYFYYNRKNFLTDVVQQKKHLLEENPPYTITFEEFESQLLCIKPYLDLLSITYSIRKISGKRYLILNRKDNKTVSDLYTFVQNEESFIKRYHSEKKRITQLFKNQYSKIVQELKIKYKCQIHSRINKIGEGKWCFDRLNDFFREFDPNFLNHDKTIFKNLISNYYLKFIFLSIISECCKACDDNVTSNLQMKYGTLADLTEKIATINHLISVICDQSKNSHSIFRNCRNCHNRLRCLNGETHHYAPLKPITNPNKIPRISPQEITNITSIISTNYKNCFDMFDILNNYNEPLQYFKDKINSFNKAELTSFLSLYDCTENSNTNYIQNCKSIFHILLDQWIPYLDNVIEAIDLQDNLTEIYEYAQERLSLIK